LIKVLQNAYPPTFTVARSPEDVFAFMVQPENLAKWQTIKTYVMPLTEGPTRLGSRFREGSKVGPRQWDQVVEVIEFESGRAFAVKVTEGPESSGRWTMQPEGAGARAVRRRLQRAATACARSQDLHRAPVSRVPREPPTRGRSSLTTRDVSCQPRYRATSASKGRTTAVIPQRRSRHDADRARLSPLDNRYYDVLPAKRQVFTADIPLAT
jgi:uncharacterized protein YndB with AHSA1/START domain